MNRRDFGELVCALRTDMGWTQFQLSEYSGVDSAVISQVERGVKKHFEPELLFSLANVFQLTTLERREFIFAASGLDEQQIVRQASQAMASDGVAPKRVLARMVALTGEIRLPAYLIDVYSDIVAANYIMLAFYNVPASVIESAARVPGGYNTTRLNFGRDMVGRNRIVENWDNYAVNAMRAFRENNLQYRAKPYCKQLMKLFRNPAEYPFFDRYWKMVSSTEQDKEVNIDRFCYQHYEFGPLMYMTATTVAITSSGNLLLVQNLPLDQHTEEVFNHLRMTAGLGVERFAPWPEKPILK